jgi:hypothetical protein
MRKRGGLCRRLLGRVLDELNNNFVAIVYPVQIQSSNRLPPVPDVSQLRANSHIHVFRMLQRREV